MGKQRIGILWLSGLLLFSALLLPACSSSSGQDSSAGSTESQSQSAANVGDAARSQAQEAAPAPNQSAEAEASGAVLPSAVNRKMIYTANLRLEVENYRNTRTALEAAIARHQGYILSAEDYESDQEKGGTVVVRVPQTGYQPFLSEIEKLAVKVPERSITGQDVTEEYVDLSSRLKAKQVVEERLTQFLAEAKKTEDLLKISNDLGKVQEEIEQIKGRMRYLDEHVAFATITLSIAEKKGTAKLSEVADEGTWNKAWLALNRSILAIIAFFNALIIFFAGALPILILLCIPGVILLWLWRRKQRQTPPPPTRIDS
jgi:hypothetical protein